MSPTYIFPKSNPAAKPAGLTGPLSQAWDYLANRGGVCRAEEFDDDFAPIGPSLRGNLSSLGVKSSTSGKVTIIFFE